MATNGLFVQLGPFLNSGSVVNGAKIYHYAAGTTTLKDVYTDRAKTTTAAQPIVADSNGVVSFYADGLYKLKVDTSADVTLYTWDNVNLTEADFATGEGAALTAASTLTLGTDGNYFHVTGSTGITAISGTQGVVWLTFDSTPALTHSGNLVLPYGQNHTMTAGETAWFINDGSGVWRMGGSTLIANPLTTLGDTVYGGATGKPTRLAGNTTTTPKYLKQTGDGAASAAPAWTQLALGDMANQSANAVAAGPTSGGAAAPTFRALVAADIPSLDAAKITTGSFSASQIGSGAIVQAKLSTSTGSATGAGGLGVAANAYSFGPSITNDTGANAMVAAYGAVANPGDQVMRFAVNQAPNATGGAAIGGNSTANWRYVNSSANPSLWVIADLDGTILAVWESEDAIQHVPIALLDRPDLTAVQVAWPDDLQQDVSLDSETPEEAPATLASDDIDGELPKHEAKPFLTVREQIELRQAIHPELAEMPNRCDRLQRCFALRALAKDQQMAPAEVVRERYKLINGALAKK